MWLTEQNYFNDFVGDFVNSESIIKKFMHAKDTLARKSHWENA